jgi:hypothetical protein
LGKATERKNMAVAYDIIYWAETFQKITMNEKNSTQIKLNLNKLLIHSFRKYKCSTWTITQCTIIIKYMYMHFFYRLSLEKYNNYNDFNNICVNFQTITWVHLSRITFFISHDSLFRKSWCDREPTQNWSRIYVTQENAL